MVAPSITMDGLALAQECKSLKKCWRQEYMPTAPLALIRYVALKCALTCTSAKRWSSQIRRASRERRTASVGFSGGYCYARRRRYF
mmetsp:Transcript_179720/g.569970  ORF Transcript_179720/g.569970 Transcript_179720/m.569970 type:complete len:86 (+) Transcript_179720:795-1052(+)